jgi:hypothetical protein
MKWHSNSAKHKATHRGYRSKPTQAQISATLSLFSDIILLPNKCEKKYSEQLKLF